MYSTILRILTAFVGAALVGFGILITINGRGEIGSIIIACILGLLGLYLIIAAFIPHRSVTESVGDEVFWRLVFEIPLRLISRLASKLMDVLN